MCSSDLRERVVTESGSPVSRFLITVLIQYLREIRGSIPSASYHANRGSHRFWMVRPVSARASEICDDGYSRGCNWRAADESHCQFQSHCGWIELRVHYRAENNLSGPTRTGPAKDHDRGREGLHPTGAPHGTFAHLVGFNQDYKTARVDRNWSFIFYALRPGFVRLFAEVQIEGRSRFAPFDLRIAP